MKTILTNLMNWFQITGYRKASFDRILGVVPDVSTYDQLNDLIDQYPEYLRTARLKGGFPGLALQESAFPYRVLQEQGAVEVTPLKAPTAAGDVWPTLLEPAPAPMMAPAIPFPTQSSEYDVAVPGPAKDVSPAPMVQPTAMDAEIQSEHYRNVGSAIKAPMNSPAYNVTLCILILKNGFVMIGKSACVNSANFNEEIGKRLAKEDAIKQITPYLGWRIADARMFSTDYKFG